METPDQPTVSHRYLEAVLPYSLEMASMRTTRIIASVGLPLQFIGCIAILIAPGVIGMGALILSGGDSLFQGIVIAILTGIAGLIFFLVERGRYRAGVERCLAALKRTMGVPTSGPASRSASVGT